MKPQDRKAAIAAWKERKPAPAGIFSLTCTADGQIWVGESRNLEAQQNGLWFSLRLGSHLNRKAQTAYAAHGRDAFLYAAVILVLLFRPQGLFAPVGTRTRV